MYCQSMGGRLLVLHSSIAVVVSRYVHAASRDRLFARVEGVARAQCTKIALISRLNAFKCSKNGGKTFLYCNYYSRTTHSKSYWSLMRPTPMLSSSTNVASWSGIMIPSSATRLMVILLTIMSHLHEKLHV